MFKTVAAALQRRWVALARNSGVSPALFVKGRPEARRILMIPNWAWPNPYQSRLAAGLSRLGYDVRLGPNTTLLLLATAALFRPEIIHLHWPDSFWISKSKALSAVRRVTFCLVLQALTRLGAKLVWTIHELINHDQIHRDQNERLNRCIAALASRIIVHSRILQEEIAAAVPAATGKMETISHPSYLDCYDNSASELVSRVRLSLPREGFIFVCLGMLRPYKGILELIAAFQQLEGAEVHLLLAGMYRPESFLTEMQNAIGQDRRIILRPGFVPEDEVQYVLNAANAVVLPYRAIHASGSLMLAMSFAKPAIVPRLGVIPETVGAAEAIIYEPDRKDGLKNALRWALDHPDALKTMGQAALARAGSLTWEKCADETSRCYLNAASGATAG